MVRVGEVTMSRMMGRLGVCRRMLVPGSKRCLVQPIRGLAGLAMAAREHVDIFMEEREGHTIATLSLNCPPVNSFNISYAAAVSSALEEVEYSSADAMILKSALPSTFSVGLKIDLNVLYGISEESLREFGTHKRDIWYRLYSSRLAKVAAINGHCLAGGTILAAACDYCIASQGQYRIGVPVAKIGLVSPPVFLKMLTHLMGQRRTELYLQQGTTFTPDEALSVGLIDEVCPPEELETRCYEALRPFLFISQEARARMGFYLREELLEQFRATTEDDMERFVSFVLRDSVQERIGRFIQQMKMNN